MTTVKSPQLPRFSPPSTQPGAFPRSRSARRERWPDRAQWLSSAFQTTLGFFIGLAVASAAVHYGMQHPTSTLPPIPQESVNP